MTQFLVAGDQFSASLIPPSARQSTPENTYTPPHSVSETSPPRCPPPISVMRLSQCILLLCLAHQQGKKGRAKFIHARYRMDFFKTLSIEEQRRRYQKIPRFALIPLKLSPWQKLLHSQNDQAFITMMGFDAESFDRILVKFGPIFFRTHTFSSESEWDDC